MKANRGQIVGLVLVAGALLLGLPQSAHGDLIKIPTLYNTGVDANGVRLGSNVSDLDYTVTRTGTNSFANAPTYTWRDSDGWPIVDNTWLTDGQDSEHSLYYGDSAWITPYLAKLGSGDTDPNGAGTYIYRMTFNLTGATMTGTNAPRITGVWSSDNDGASIRLNGQDVRDLEGTLFVTPFTAFHDWYDFGISTGFLPGLNTLEFVVNNGTGSGNPTGLRVAMLGEADWGSGSAPTNNIVPEPASLSVLGMGIVGMAVARMRRKRA